MLTRPLLVQSPTHPLTVGVGEGVAVPQSATHTQPLSMVRFVHRPGALPPSGHMRRHGRPSQDAAHPPKVGVIVGVEVRLGVSVGVGVNVAQAQHPPTDGLSGVQTSLGAQLGFWMHIPQATAGQFSRMVGQGTQRSLQYGVPVGAQVGVEVDVAVGVPLGVSVAVSVGLDVGVGVAVSVEVVVGVGVLVGIVGVFAVHRDPPIHDALDTIVQPKHVPDTGAAQNWLGFCAEPEHWQQAFASGVLVGLTVRVEFGVNVGLGVPLSAEVTVGKVAHMTLATTTEITRCRSMGCMLRPLPVSRLRF